MDITIFLGQLWGPVLLALGIGFFVSPEYYKKTYRNLQNETLATLIFSVIAITVGIIQIKAHNIWSTFPQIVISLLGWGTLLKGIVFAVAPKLVDKSGDWAVHAKLIPRIGVALLVIGVYLCCISYFG